MEATSVSNDTFQLQTVDAKITSAERKRARLEELFQAILGQLMTGRVRTTPLIDSNRV